MMDRPIIGPALPLGIFLLTGVIWLMTVVAAHRLFYAFRREFPQIAAERIPYAFEPIAHPMKGTYLLSSEARGLIETHPGLSRLRVHFVVLLILSVIVPTLGFGALFVAVALLR